MLWLAATAVVWCQGTMAFESDVAKFEPGPVWIAGPSDLCRSYTIISPDGAGHGKARVRVGAVPEKAKKMERVVMPSSALGEMCNSTYRLKTVEATRCATRPAVQGGGG